jgi:hypothetical protein
MNFDNMTHGELEALKAAGKVNMDDFNKWLRSGLDYLSKSESYSTSDLLPGTTDRMWTE